MTAINQMQISYAPLEDRLMLRVNTTNDQEFRFWLTRRYVLLLYQALAAHRAKDPDISSQPVGEARQAVQQFKQEKAAEKGDFEQSFRDSSDFPLGETPVLASKLQARSDQGKLALTISPAQGNGINLVLDEHLNFNFSRLLNSAVAKAEWGIQARSAAPAAGSPVIN